jgi:hypothetical protein
MHFIFGIFFAHKISVGVRMGPSERYSAE